MSNRQDRYDLSVKVGVENWGTWTRGQDRESGKLIRLYELRLSNHHAPSELKARAIECLQATQHGLENYAGPSVCRWLEVDKDEYGWYAVCEDDTAPTVTDLWCDVARRVPHDIEYCWRKAEEMANDTYVVSKYDNSNRLLSTEERLGPWDPSDTMPASLSPSCHRPVRVGVSPIHYLAAVELVAKVSNVLERLHRHGLTHGCLRPPMIRVMPTGAIRLAGIGTWALEKCAASCITSKTSTDFYAYLAPEQLSLEAKPGPASDVYSMGVLLHELLTFGRAFRRATLIATIRAVSEGQLGAASTINQSVPDELDAVIARATAIDPTERFGSCAELVDALPLESGSANTRLEALVAKLAEPTDVSARPLAL